MRTFPCPHHLNRNAGSSEDDLEAKLQNARTVLRAGDDAEIRL